MELSLLTPLSHFVGMCHSIPTFLYTKTPDSWNFILKQLFLSSQEKKYTSLLTFILPCLRCTQIFPFSWSDVGKFYSIRYSGTSKTHSSELASG